MHEGGAQSGAPRGGRSIAMLLGAFDSPSRVDDVSTGRRPANDVTVLTEQLGAELFDFAWLEASDGATRSRRVWASVARRSGQWSAALALATAFEVRRYDVVYVSGEDIGLFACFASRLLPGRSPRWIVRFERPVYGRNAVVRFLYRTAMRFASRRFALALCRTAGLAEILRAYCHLPAERVVAFGQEIDTKFFDPDSAATASVEVPEPYIVSAGLERRDYATLLDAVEGLSVTLVIAAGSPWSKDAFDVDRELPANVVVGTYAQNEMRELYRGAQCVVLSVLPTERACGMNVIGEAWAMRRPVVASASHGLSEFVEHGSNGLLVAPGDAVAMRASIEQARASDEVLAPLGLQGRRYVERHLSLDRFRSHLEDAIT